MKRTVRLRDYARPYWRQALAAIVTLFAMAMLDLAIPRLIQRLIDHGIARNDQPLIIQTALIMIGISLLTAVIAIANNITSIRVGEGVARDVRRALFLEDSVVLVWQFEPRAHRRAAGAADQRHGRAQDGHADFAAHRQRARR